MNEAEYLTELQSILNLSALVRHLNIAGVLLAIERAETTGPILQPTLYRTALTRLEWHKKCARAALAFQRALDDIGPAPGHFPPTGDPQ